MNKAFWLAIPGLFFLAGCASKVTVPEARIANPDAAWARVLKRFVNEKGHVDFAGLSRDRRDLEEYVAFVAKKSPQSDPASFPSPDHKLAYYLNSYNALSMYNVILRDIPKDNGSFFKRFGFFYLTKFSIGGEYQSLYAYENDVIRKLDDPRVHVALNCMAMSCPRLPQVPFEPKTLQTQLNAQAIEFYNEERNVQVDKVNKTVRFSEILSFFTEDFLKKSPSLVAYVNQYRKEKIPEDYRVDFIPYDWTINNQATAAAIATTPKKPH